MYIQALTQDWKVQKSLSFHTCKDKNEAISHDNFHNINSVSGLIKMTLSYIFHVFALSLDT